LQEFIVWLKRHLGAAAFEKIPEEKLRHGSRLMTDFELAKNSFSGAEAEMDIQLPRECGIEDDEEKNINDYGLTLTG
jgi:hypothetical protein